MRLTTLILSIVLVFCTCKESSVSKIPKVEKGILDLRNTSWDLRKDGPVRLDGEWEFYWSEFILPESTKEISNANNKIKADPKYITVPSNWRNFMINGKKVPDHGYATYRVKILLPQSLLTSDPTDPSSVQSFSLRLENIGSSYQAYANGKLVKTMGKVGFTKIQLKSISINK